MLPKISDLIANLEKAGFVNRNRGGKGSHRNFTKIQSSLTLILPSIQQGALFYLTTDPSGFNNAIRVITTALIECFGFCSSNIHNTVIVMNCRQDCKPP